MNANISSDDSLFCCTEEGPDMVGIYEYLLHVYQHFEVDNEYSAIIIPQAYICRLQNTDQLVLTRQNMHRVTLTAIVVSVKMYDDNFAGNDFYAQVGCIALPELNALESVFLKKMNWSLLIPEQSMVLIKS